MYIVLPAYNSKHLLCWLASRDRIVILKIIIITAYPHYLTILKVTKNKESYYIGIIVAQRDTPIAKIIKEISEDSLLHDSYFTCTQMSSILN